MKHCFRWILILMFVLNTGCLYATENKNLFHLLTDESNFKRLESMIFDGRYYWFAGRWNGLYRYDQVQRKVRKYGFEGADCLAVYEGQLWLRDSQGVLSYNSHTEKFNFFNKDAGIPTILNFRDEYVISISAIVADKFWSKIWVGTLYSGLCYYDIENNEWKRIIDPMVKDIDVDSISVNDKILAVATEHQLFYYDKQNQKWYSTGLYMAEDVKIHLLDIEQDSIIFRLEYFGHGKVDKCRVISFDTRMKHFKKIYEVDERVDCMVKHQDYLVFSSFCGLSFYHRPTKKTFRFDRTCFSAKATIGYTLITYDSEFEKKSEKKIVAGDGFCAPDEIYIINNELWGLAREGVFKADLNEVLASVRNGVKQ